MRINETVKMNIKMYVLFPISGHVLLHVDCQLLLCIYLCLNVKIDLNYVSFVLFRIISAISEALGGERERERDVNVDVHICRF
jgi:hypothetical protein